jgi:hypothetical protein
MAKNALFVAKNRDITLKKYPKQTQKQLKAAHFSSKNIKKSSIFTQKSLKKRTFRRF